jgi:hypothetical protein
VTLPASESYLEVRKRLRERHFPADVAADIELYRQHWERFAYELGVVMAQHALGVPPGDVNVNLVRDSCGWEPIRDRVNCEQ